MRRFIAVSILRNAGISGLAGLSALACVPAHAQLTFYSDRGSFLAATENTTTVDFEGLTQPFSDMYLPTPPGITLSGANFTIDHSTANNGMLFVVSPDNYYAGNSVLSSNQSYKAPDNLVITLPEPTTAFALDFGTFYGGDFVFTTSAGDTFTRTAPAMPNLDFVGFSSSMAFTSVTLTRTDINHADPLNVDNVTFGSVKSYLTAAPEPGTLALLALALPVAGLVRRRKA